MNNPKAKKVGEQWEKRFKDVVYLMEKQPNGVDKAIKRITPYVNPRKANSLSGIPETAGKPVSKKMPINGGNNWVVETLNKNKDVKIRKPDYETKKIRLNKSTEIIVAANIPDNIAVSKFRERNPNFKITNPQYI